MKKHLKVILIIATLASCTSREKTKDSFSSESIAYAFPVQNVIIDGDLSDWPKDIEKYELTLVREYKGDTNKEYDGYYQIGYNKADNSLLIALSIPADSTPVINKNGNWNDQDSYSLYIDEQNVPFGSGVCRYSFNKELSSGSDPNKSWDPNLKAYFDWGKIEKTENNSGDRRIIELKYQLSKPIQVGNTLGINHVVIDANTSNAYHDYYVWVDNPYSYKTAGRLGNVVIADKALQIAKIDGTIKLDANDNKKLFPQKVIIQNIKNPEQWVRTKVDSTGNFHAKLPIGDYKFVLDNNFIKPGERYVRLSTNPEWGKIELGPEGMSSLELSLSKVDLPGLLPEEGILQDGFSLNDAMQIDTFVKTYMSYYDIPGVSLTIFSEGQIVYSNAYGFGNQFTKEPITANTIFEGASMTKPMFAFAVMRLVEKGIVDLDKPLYLDAKPPEDIAENPWYRLITPRLVLSHQTGLPNWAYDTDDGRLYFKFKPGTGISYSGAGFTYLTRAVENITQKSIIEIMQEEVVDVLDLHDVYFHDVGGFGHRKAKGHLFNYARIEEIPDYPEMASSVHTNALEFAKFILAISKRKGLSKAMYKAMMDRVVLRNERIESGKLCKRYYGLGWNLRDSPFFGLSFGHSGSNGDFKCTSTFYENSGNGFVVMTNSNTGSMLQYHLHNLLNIGKVQLEP
ncbi:MAG: serine hydrolase domain-containing protein [Bacteroidota bacterium]